jgi:spermidine synthase
MNWHYERGQVYSFMVLGSSSILAQVVLLRDSMAILQGNELTVGIFIALWMILNALGAWIGGMIKSTSSSNIILLHLILPLLTWAAYLLLPMLVRDITPAGSMVDLLPASLKILVHLIPVTVPLGMLFPMIATAFKARGNQLVGSGYGLEGAGSIIGGILLNAGIIIFLDVLHIWILLGVTNFGMGLYLATGSSAGQTRKIISVVFALTVFSLLLSHESQNNRSFLLPEEELLEISETPYGILKAAKLDGQVNFYQNNIPLFTTGDVIQPEEDVHTALSMHPNPANVLIISRGNPAVIDEALKYEVGTLTYIEMDPWLYDFTDRHLDIPEPRELTVIKDDPIRYLDINKTTYDVILVLVPTPSTTLLNRYYTTEFFKLAREHLHEGGIISVGLSTTGNYMDDASLMSHSILNVTLGRHFENIMIVPAGQNYFIASDRELSYQIIQNIEELGISTTHFNSGYFDDMMLQFRGRQIAGQLHTEAPVNRNFKPTNYRYELLHQLNLFKISPLPFIILLSVVLLLALLFLPPVKLGLFSGGLTMASLQILIMMAFQSLFGMLYHLVGIFITLFMAGLFAGSWAHSRGLINTAFHVYLANQAAIGMIMVLFAISLSWSEAGILSTAAIQSLLYLFAFLSGILMGIHFSLGAGLTTAGTRKTASGNYGIDLAGSALGTLLASFLLFPLAGIVTSAYILAILNLVVIILLLLKQKLLVHL